jgi:hypothetical protein
MDGGEFVPLLGALKEHAPESVREQARVLLSVPVSHANFRLERDSLNTA